MYPAQFAAVYDRLMDDVDYPAWADYYRALLSRARDGAPVRKVCECGCGTGSMTVELARAGLEVVGVDLSAPMLEIAGDKLRRAGVSAPLVCQDMCRLQLHRPVDALVCPCDGVNYLVEDSQVAAFFRRAYALLKPGERWPLTGPPPASCSPWSRRLATRTGRSSPTYGSAPAGATW